MVRGVIAGAWASIFGALIAAFLVLESGQIPASVDTRPGVLEGWAASSFLEATPQNRRPRASSEVLARAR